MMTWRNSLTSLVLSQGTQTWSQEPAPVKNTIRKQKNTTRRAHEYRQWWRLYVDKTAAMHVITFTCTIQYRMYPKVSIKVTKGLLHWKTIRQMRGLWWRHRILKVSRVSYCMQLILFYSHNWCIKHSYITCLQQLVDSWPRFIQHLVLTHFHITW